MAVTVNQSLTTISTNPNNNTAVVRYVVKCTTSGESYNNNTQTGNFVINGTSYSSDYKLPLNTTTTVFSKDVTISSASGRTISASYSFPTTPYYGTQTGSTSLTIPTILTGAKFTVQEINSKGIDWVKIRWATDKAVESAQYSLSEGPWKNIDNWTSRGSTFTISNLKPNTFYNVRVLVKANGITTVSNWLEFYTYDIAKISSLSDFVHGNSIPISISNPANATPTLKMSIGSEQILSQNLNTGSNTLNLTDEQLDNIYRKYSNSNKVAVIFNVITNNNSSWSNSKTVNCTLTGNQKTARVKKDIWKRGIVWIYTNNTWKRAVTWINEKNIWKRGI